MKKDKEKIYILIIEETKNEYIEFHLCVFLLKILAE